VSDPDSIRAAYEKHGAREFYEQSGARYRNPHEPQIRRSLERAVQTWRPDLSRVLDLAAGSGEVTLALRDLGAGSVEGADPYTADAYQARTGNTAEQFSFEDIAAGVLAGRRYSLVACSFALHLCEPSRLPAVAYQLSLVANSLLILTPHKRPHLRPEWGWRLVEEQVVERVRCRYYAGSVTSATLE
jgi:hypothetical protein